MKISYKIIVLFSLFSFISITLNAKSYTINKQGIEACVDGIVVKLQCYSNSIIRVVKYPQETMPEKHSYSVVMNPGIVDFKTEECGDENVVLITDSVKTKLNLRDGSVTMSDVNNNILLREKFEGKQFTPVEYGEYSTYQVRQAFRLDKDEKIFGLGQHQKGLFNQRNQLVKLRQHNTEIAIPYWYSLKGYGLLWDNSSPTDFTDNSIETSFDSQCGECSDYYFIYGGNAKRVLNNLRRLTGGVQMNALWTYGYWQSKERYQSQKEIVDVVKKYRELEVPLDCIVQDWQYWGIDANNWNAVEFNNPNFEDAAKMVEDIHQLNAHIAISVWPSSGRNTWLYNEFKQKGMLLNFKTYPEQAQVYDTFNPEARNIYWKRMKENLLSIGIDGWWLDATEPEFSDKDECLNQSTHDGLYRSVYNAFPITSVGGVYNNHRATDNSRRVFILTRSAFTGQQRYGACTWSGDIHATWQVLRNQIPAGLNLSVCGIPYWNTDIGGFITWESYRQGVNDPAYHELYVRWLQFGTFCPLMRSHGTNTPREIYQFGKPGSWQFETISRYIRLRYKLLPYIYSTAWSVTSQGETFMRPLFMDYCHDKDACNIDNQYLFGNSIMVAPVTQPMNVDAAEITESTTQKQRVYLPKGNMWYDYWTNSCCDGGKWIEKELTISDMPIYIKAGSIIPFGKDVQHTVNYDWSNLSVNVYAGRDGNFMLYCDEGDGYDYEKGENCRIAMSWNQDAHTFTIHSRQGSYKGMPQKIRFTVNVVDGNRIVKKTITYKGKEIKMKF
ncbi:MAG: TIM-barrel domain-containing protein [Muribaculaceae bacterium]